MALLDSNTIIYLALSIDDVLQDNEEHSVSVITYMEVLGYDFDSKDEENFIRSLLSYFEIIYIDEVISNKVIELRKNCKIKLPDAIICSSSIVNNEILVTCDMRLKNISELNIRLLKPF